MSEDVEPRFHYEFLDDLASYLKSGSSENWTTLTENYPFEAEGNGRYHFFPGGLENGEMGRTIVQKNLNNDLGSIDMVSGDIYDGISSYLQESDAMEKLTILAELEDRFDHAWISEDRIRFGPTEENGVVLGAPNLGEIADSYNARGTDTVMDQDERQFLSELASETSTQIGSLSKTVYIDGDRFFVEEDRDDDTYFYEVDAAGDAVSVEEVFHIYEMIRDSENKENGSEVFNAIGEAYKALEHEDLRLWLDTENQQLLSFDTDTIDASIMSFEEAEEHLDDSFLERAIDFYDGLKSNPRGDEP